MQSVGVGLLHPQPMPSKCRTLIHERNLGPTSRINVVQALYLSIHLSVCLSVYLSIYLPSYMYIYIYTHTHTYIYIYIYVYFGPYSWGVVHQGLTVKPSALGSRTFGASTPDGQFSKARHLFRSPKEGSTGIERMLMLTRTLILGFPEIRVPYFGVLIILRRSESSSHSMLLTCNSPLDSSTSPPPGTIIIL